MKSLITIIIILIISSFLISSAVYVAFNESEEEPENDDTGPDEEPDDEPDDQDNTDDEPDEEPDDVPEEFVHSVFVEEATFTTCKYCPEVANILEELYDSGNYRFYFISLVKDMNDKAFDRIEEEYNIYGYPTVYIDGGYRVVNGVKTKNDYADVIKAAEKRDVPELKIDVTAKYDENISELTTDVVIKSNESASYEGNLKIYLAQIVSPWADFDGNAYHFAFIDYIADENIEVSSKGNLTKTKTYETDLDPENLMVYAVLFSSEKNTGYSKPDDNENSFDAYYADAVGVTEVVEGGNLPPAVGISMPQAGKIHLFGNPIFNFALRNTFLIGKTTIEVNAEDDSAIAKVEFYIDDDLVFEDTEAPYEYEFKKVDALKHIVRKHTIKVIAYDDTDKTTSTELEVIGIFL